MLLVTAKRILLAVFIFTFVKCANVQAQPKVLHTGVSIKQLAVLGHNTVRIRRDPVSGDLYVLQNNGIIQRVNFSSDSSSATLTTVYTTSDHGLNAPLGMTFGSDGTMYLVGNDSTSVLGTATIVKGIPDTVGGETRTWSVIATTVPYAYGNIYNHRMSGIILNPTGDSLYVNSGAGTDHGEVENGYREVGLTSIILRLPVDGNDVILQDDRSWLRSNGYLFCEGIRNEFDFAYDGNGDLIGVENSGDRDDPEEINWLRPGLHYGFPWRISTDITPQQFTPYDSHSDPLLSPYAWGGGNLYKTFSNDTSYPAAPDSITFTYPILSYGPDADHFRDTATGQVMDASQSGTTISSLTPHRSPDGIAFDRDSILAGDLKGGGFVISVATSRLVSDLGDTSQDLLVVNLVKDTGNYTAHVTRMISGFNSPLGEELVGNRLFVVETGLEQPNGAPKLWEITLPTSGATGIKTANENPAAFQLRQNYPNPFNPTTKISFSVPELAEVTISVYNLLGQKIRTLVRGTVASGDHIVEWDGRNSQGQSVPSGVYFYRLSQGSRVIATDKMILLK